MIKKLLSTLLMAGILLALAGHAAAQTPTSLTVGSGSGLPGDTGISLPVSLQLSTGTQVASLQFYLIFDEALLSVGDVAEGEAALAASKSASWSVPSPGQLRVLVANLDNNAIDAGVV